MDNATADTIRKSMLQEAAGIDGLGTCVPSPSSLPWRWPIRRNTDKAYWEVEDCD